MIVINLSLLALSIVLQTAPITFIHNFIVLSSSFFITSSLQSAYLSQHFCSKGKKPWLITLLITQAVLSLRANSIIDKYTSAHGSSENY